MYSSSGLKLWRSYAFIKNITPSKKIVLQKLEFYCAPFSWDVIQPVLLREINLN